MRSGKGFSLLSGYRGVHSCGPGYGRIRAQLSCRSVFDRGESITRFQCQDHRPCFVVRHGIRVLRFTGQLRKGNRLISRSCGKGCSSGRAGTVLEAVCRNSPGGCDLNRRHQGKPPALAATRRRSCHEEVDEAQDRRSVHWPRDQRLFPGRALSGTTAPWSAGHPRPGFMAASERCCLCWLGDPCPCRPN